MGLPLQPDGMTGPAPRQRRPCDGAGVYRPAKKSLAAAGQASSGARRGPGGCRAPRFSPVPERSRKTANPSPTPVGSAAARCAQPQWPGRSRHNRPNRAHHRDRLKHSDGAGSPGPNPVLNINRDLIDKSGGAHRGRADQESSRGQRPGPCDLQHWEGLVGDFAARPWCDGYARSDRWSPRGALSDWRGRHGFIR